MPKRWSRVEIAEIEKNEEQNRQAHKNAFTQPSGEFSIALNASLDIVRSSDETNQKELKSNGAAAGPAADDS